MGASIPTPRVILLALLTLAVAAILGGCGGSDSDGGADSEDYFTGGSSAEGEPVQGGTLIFARTQEPLTFDPVASGENGSIWHNIQLYDQLVEQLPGESEVQPGVAESWQISEDGLTYDFELRKGMQFSNGDPVTGEDVKFSIDRLSDESVSVFPFVAQNFRRTSLRDGGRVFRIELRKPTPALLDNLSLVVASIVPKDVVTELGDEKFGQQPVGSGPFKVERFEPGQEVELVRNEFYWREGQPYLDGVVFRYVTDTNARVLGVRSGDIHVAEAVPFAQIDALSNTEGIQMLVEEGYVISNFSLNHAREPLDQVEFRQALNLATPREEMAESIFGGRVEIANGILPKVEYWDESIEPTPYDPERARELIQSSGNDGVEVTLGIPSGEADAKQLAAVVQESWGEVGVNLQIRTLELATLFEDWFAGKLDMAYLLPDTSDVPVPDVLASILQDSTSAFDAVGTNYESKEATELVETATTALDESVREEAFVELQQISLDDAQKVLFFYQPYRTAVRDNVRNFNTLPTGWWRLEQVWLAN